MSDENGWKKAIYPSASASLSLTLFFISTRCRAYRLLST